MTNDNLIGQSVRSIQTMLSAIAMLETELPNVVSDGIFGDATRQAVAAFQRSRNIPVTGAVDEFTHDSIVASYDSAMELLSPPEAPILLMPAQLVIGRNQSHPIVFLVHAMFSALGQEYPQFGVSQFTGILDGPTEKNILAFQQLSGLPETGTLDKRTYNRLAKLFRSYADRAFPPAQG